MVAVPTPVLVDADASVTPQPRYQRIREEFGELAKTSLACAMHVHVGLEDGEDGAALLGEIGPWLPVLLRDQRQLAVLAGTRHRLRQLAHPDLDALAEQRDG